MSVCNYHFMKLRDEIKEHLKATGEKASKLAARAGVWPSVISRILNEKQHDISGRNYQKIQEILISNRPCEVDEKED